MREIPGLKTQEEWLEHFKDLARGHGDILTKPLVDYFADKILLTKKEVTRARAMFEKRGQPCDAFLDWDTEECGPIDGGKEDMGNGMIITHAPYTAYCRLCKKLTKFAKEQ